MSLRALLPNKQRTMTLQLQDRSAEYNPSNANFQSLTISTTPGIESFIPYQQVMNYEYPSTPNQIVHSTQNFQFTDLTSPTIPDDQCYYNLSQVNSNNFGYQNPSQLNSYPQQPYYNMGSMNNFDVNNQMQSYSTPNYTSSTMYHSANVELNPQSPTSSYFNNNQVSFTQSTNNPALRIGNGPSTLHYMNDSISPIHPSSIVASNSIPVSYPQNPSNIIINKKQSGIGSKKMNSNSDKVRVAKIKDGEMDSNTLNISYGQPKFQTPGLHIPRRRRTKIPTGAKVSACTYCGLEFTRNNSLKRHMDLHTGRKDFHCGGCNKSFSRTDILKRHLASKKCSGVTDSENINEGC